MMNDILSENKYVNYAVNVLLFFLAMNFMHYGQIIIPLICLIIFIDRKFKFNVNDYRIFLLLASFGIVFFVFSKRDDLFCFMGMMIPMAYYIGSNIYEPDKEKIKNIIYLLSFGMAFHVILNFGYDLAIRGIECFTRNSHLDFWYKDEFPTTQTAVNYVFMLGIFYYLVVYEKNKKVVCLLVSTFAIIMIYAIALGRRTPFVLFAIALFVPTLIDRQKIARNAYQKNKIVKIMVFSLITFSVLILGYFFNFLGLKEFVSNLSITKKISRFGL